MAGIYFNCRLNKIAQNSFKVLTILSNYFSFTLQHVSGPVSLRLYKAIGLKYWLIIALNYNLIAYV